MSNDLTGLIIKSHYKLLEMLEGDTLAVKYIVRDILLNNIYIMKILYPELAGDQSLLIRFQREAHILGQIDNQHCVSVFDYGKDHHLHYTVMEYIDGQNLKYYITSFGPLDPLLAIHYILQAAQGLDAAYKIGVVHRDIKPQNILINNKGAVKIDDFGLSRSKESPTITSLDKFMGTAYYTAPEQVMSSHSADIRSDLYSLGIVMFEALAGYPPYSGGTVVDIILKHQSEDIPSICRIYPGLPYEFDTFMQKAMAKQPEDRFQTPREFIHALEQIQQLIKTNPLQKPVTPNRSQDAIDDTVRRIIKSSQKKARFYVLASNQYIELTGEQMIVGRQDPVLGIFPEINLPDKTVGRRHAYVRNQQEQYTVEDLNALNKTRLNGVILTPHEERTLKDGDILRFGSVEVRFELR